MTKVFFFLFLFSLSLSLSLSPKSLSLGKSFSFHSPRNCRLCLHPLMDYSKYPFCTEGCSSSESGWTMYIDSPMEEDDMECNTEDYDNNDRKSNDKHDIDNADNKEDSDDSMASDASSGPSHHQHRRANAEGSHSVPSSKHGKSDLFKKLFSWKKSNEKEKKGEHSSKQKHKAYTHKKYFK